MGAPQSAPTNGYKLSSALLAVLRQRRNIKRVIARMLQGVGNTVGFTYNLHNTSLMGKLKNLPTYHQTDINDSSGFKIVIIFKIHLNLTKNCVVNLVRLKTVVNLC